MKKTLYIFILFVFCFTNSTCRKASKYPVKLLGYWIGFPIGGSSNCEKVLLDITNDRNGSFGGGTGAKGCNTKVNGTVRFNKNHLYVGITKFKFIDKPTRVENGDTATIDILHKGRVFTKVCGKMTLMNSILNGKIMYNFIKVLEY